MAIPPKWYQFLVGVFASLGSLLFGYDLGVIAQVVASKNFKAKFQAAENEEGAVVSVFTGGAFVGAALAGPLGDYLGRRKTILIGAIIFLLGGALQTGAQALSYLYSGRLIAGIGVGVLCMIVPLYQAELAHPSIRGRITALQQFMLGVGALIAAWVSWACEVNFAPTNEGQWRTSLGIQCAPAVLLAALIMLFPESPRWLIDHGRVDLGLRTLAKLHAHGNVDDAWVRAEFEQIQESIAYEHEIEAKSYAELFTDRSCFRRLFLACSIQASIQMTGVSAIHIAQTGNYANQDDKEYYSPRIYAQMGIAVEDTLKYQAISSCIALFAQFLCILFIDRLGRRWTLIGGMLGNMVTFIIATALMASFPPPAPESGEPYNTSAAWAFTVITWLYNFSFSATSGPLSWIIPAEIFDTKTRSKGVSLATMTSFAFNTMIGQVTPIAMKDIGWRFYILFVVCNLTNALFFWAVLPETAKRPLEEMNYLFKNAPLFVSGTQWTKKPGRETDLESRVRQVEAKQDQ